jgi:alcohol dehydrogenase class IV
MHNQKSEKCGKTAVKERMTKKRILIVGDSHNKGMATELQHNLDKNFVVQGLVKTGADLEVILRSNMKECKNLTKKDVLIILGGGGYNIS